MANGITDRLIDRLLVRGTVESVGRATPRMRAVRVTAPGLDWTPGQQIRVLVGSGLLGARRTYSVWDYDGEALDLRVLDHGGEGPGAQWGRSVTPGQEILFGRPEGRFVTRPGAFHLFVGEETAAVAFGPMVRSLDGAPVFGVLEVDTQEDRLPIDLTWRYRHGTAAADSASLVAAVKELELPDGPGSAYVAGEARTVQAVRNHLVTDRGWPRRSVLTKPFWAPGRKGME